MNYQQAKREAPEYLAALEKCLDDHSSAKQIDFSYETVARAFPSSQGHSRYFEYNVIEHEELTPWAKQKGWDVEQIRDKVRFTKIAK